MFHRAREVPVGFEVGSIELTLSGGTAEASSVVVLQVHLAAPTSVQAHLRVASSSEDICEQQIGVCVPLAVEESAHSKTARKLNFPLNDIILVALSSSSEQHLRWRSNCQGPAL